MNRPDESELLAQVLKEIEDLPNGFAERLLALLEQGETDRAQTVRQLFEEYSRE